MVRYTPRKAEPPMIEPYYADEWVTLYHGDCLDVMPTLHDSTADLVLTDPPYGTTDCEWDKNVPLPELWKLWRHALRADGAVVMTASQPFTSQAVMSNLARFKHEWIWQKNAGSNFGTVKYQPMKEHESVLVFCWGRLTYNPIMQARTAAGLSRVQTVVNYDTAAPVYGSGGLVSKASSMRPDLRYPSSVQKFNRERGLHPTQKPVDLMRYMVDTYSEGGQVVLDPFAGSGSTLVAARAAQRYSIGIEKNERYCEVIASRLRSLATPEMAG